MVIDSAFMDLVIEMRQVQKRYWDLRVPADLNEARRLEHEIDLFLERYEVDQVLLAEWKKSVGQDYDTEQKS